MQYFSKRHPISMAKWAIFAVLPLAGCTTVETTAFSPIVLPNGCVVGDNYPSCKSINTTCSDPITIESSYYDYYDSGSSDSAARQNLSNCKNKLASCIDDLAASGFIGQNIGQCVPQRIETSSLQGTLDKEVEGEIWYLNCMNDKTSGFSSFEAATRNMEDSSAFTTEGGTSFVQAHFDNEANNTMMINQSMRDTSGFARICTASISNPQTTTSINQLGLSQFCISDFGSNLANYRAYLGGQSSSTVDYNNLPTTPTCKPMPPTTPPTTTTTTTTTSSTPFTGTTVGLGYTRSTTEAAGTSLSNGNMNVSVGYTVPLAPSVVGTNTVTPTIGVNAGVTIGNQGTVRTGGTTATQCGEFDYGCVAASGSTNTTQISNTVAVSAQPGVIINNNVQVYANVGGVVANRDVSNSQSRETGSRIGAGVGVSVSDQVSVNVQANRDSISGTRVNSVGVGLSVGL